MRVSENINNFRKTKEFLICVDSDGCIMDTMNSKHFNCFGPCLVSEWELTEWEPEVLALWNRINLYSETRGINRFAGLALALAEISKQYKKIEDLDALIQWTNQSPALSASALSAAFAADGSKCMEKALRWSAAVNQAVEQIPLEQKRPFAGAHEALAAARKYADVAVVSSANAKAVNEELQTYDLLKHIDIVLSQSDGTKSHCIQSLAAKGYDKNNIMMLGDSPGDEAAAEDSEVWFYPILVDQETESWNKFVAEAFGLFLEGKYSREYQLERKTAFHTNMQKRNK